MPAARSTALCTAKANPAESGSETSATVSAANHAPSPVSVWTLHSCVSKPQTQLSRPLLPSQYLTQWRHHASSPTCVDAWGTQPCALGATYRPCNAQACQVATHDPSSVISLAKYTRPSTKTLIIAQPSVCRPRTTNATMNLPISLAIRTLHDKQYLPQCNRHAPTLQLATAVAELPMPHTTHCSSVVGPLHNLFVHNP